MSSEGSEANQAGDSADGQDPRPVAPMDQREHPHEAGPAGDGETGLYQLRETASGWQDGSSLWIGETGEPPNYLRPERRIRENQKMEALGALAAGIAHDFNNILQGILGCNQIVAESLPPDSKNAELMRDSLNAIDRAGALIQQILTFGQQVEGEKQEVVLHPIVKQALKLLRETIPATIEIKQTLVSEGDGIYADPVQMHQVILNLCTNAWQAMRQTGGTLQVESNVVQVDSLPQEIRSRFRCSHAVRLAVRDDGCGMNDATISRIFEPYYTTKSNDGGTGLGLAVVHGIVADHGGVIRVDSTPGVGSEFTVFLPALESCVKETPLKIRTDSRQTFEGNLLFVDDEEIIVRLTGLGLRRYGYCVDAFQDPREALEQFLRKPEAYDAVISDMTMPGMLGTELIREIRNARPEIPAILCTGYSDLVDDIKAEALGINALVMKPVKYRDLAQHVADAMAE